MVERFWPLDAGRIVTSPFGPRDGGVHTGTDFGFPGGSGGRPVYAAQSGTVIYAGAASGYGGPDPAGWIVVDSDDSQGGGVFEYGHIVREVGIGARVQAGQRIGHINPSQSTNGGVAPHLHLSYMPRAYDPAAKRDPMPLLAGASNPGKPTPTAPTGGTTMPASKIDYGITKVMHGFNPNTPDGATGNSNGPRAKTLYVVVHTQQARASAVSLANFTNDSWKTQPDNPVSYNLDVDDKDTIETVPVIEGPWAAGDANSIAVHICFAGSFAEWLAGKWLETDASDGLNEDAMLTRGAKAAAGACQQFGIPVVYAGDGGKSGWPILPKGIVGHRDFGSRGGGHTDPGNGFPMDEFLRRVRLFMSPAAPSQPPAKVFPGDYTDRELLEYIAAQTGPGLDIWGEDGDLGRNAQGQRRTLRAGLAALMRKVGA